MIHNTKEILIQKFLEKGIVKFGDFVLKSGEHSSVYFDFRLLFGHPDVLELTAMAMGKEIKHMALDKTFTHVCGVPYGSLPLATIYSIQNKIPMLIRRKELKLHGTGKLIEGIYDYHTKCLIVEDVVTTGSSVIETYEVLQTQGIKVSLAIAILDRGEGGKDNLTAKGLAFIHLFTKEEILSYDANNKQPSNDSSFFRSSSSEITNFPLSKKVKLTKHPTANKLLQLMLKKSTNLCVAIDVVDSANFLRIADAVGPYVCAVKLHCDILKDFDSTFIEKLLNLKNKHNFLIFADRKFSDIGKTVSNQFHLGVHMISSFSDIVTAHIISGESVIDGLKAHPDNLPYNCQACLLIAQMSCSDNLLRDYHSTAAIKMAKKHKDFIIGFVCQNRLDYSGEFLHFVPGVSLERIQDSLGQHYITPQEAIKNGADVIIVGRSICNALDPAIEAKKYNEAIANVFVF